MKLKQYIFIIIFCLFFFFFNISIANGKNYDYTEFKTAKFETCDKIFNKLEEKCQNMICRSSLVADFAECWKKSMELKLNKRLLKLKSTHIIEFQKDMELQKSFNQATQNLCNKNCGPDGMKGIPENFCRVDAYKYRTLQAMQIDKKQLSILMINYKLKKSRKEKTKDTKFYKTFTEKLCKMPKDVWIGGNIPIDCQKNLFKELDSFEFTDDVCDLS